MTRKTNTLFRGQKQLHNFKHKKQIHNLKNEIISQPQEKQKYKKNTKTNAQMQDKKFQAQNNSQTNRQQTNICKQKHTNGHSLMPINHFQTSK